MTAFLAELHFFLYLGFGLGIRLRELGLGKLGKKIWEGFFKGLGLGIWD